NAVNEMLTDTNLVGYNPFSKVEYSTPVNYWIRFDDKAQGIHDASWQGSFGGNVYQLSGSLGCINTPLGAVEVIYNNVDYGTPVMVFY
ncbi:MAG TPA: L,D-transpeptidase, partial [Facklamia tabacinasalis]|nr:L,D-transpeptidase [Ruoffia tabacinasalis]